MARHKEVYICNGQVFTSYELVVKYCEKNSLRVTKTTSMGKGKHLIEVTSIKWNT